MTADTLIEKYESTLKRFCTEYCYWKSATVLDWCRQCPKWEFREVLEQHKRDEAKMEDDWK